MLIIGITFRTLKIKEFSVIYLEIVIESIQFILIILILFFSIYLYIDSLIFPKLKNIV